MQKAFIVVALIVVPSLIIASPGASWTKYKGYSEEDTEIARKFYNTLKDGGVYAVEVRDIHMAIHIREHLYSIFKNRKIKGEQMIRDLFRGFQRGTGEKNVKIEFYFDKTHVITADWNVWDNQIEIKYH